VQGTYSQMVLRDVFEFTNSTPVAISELTLRMHRNDIVPAFSGNFSAAINRVAPSHYTIGLNRGTATIAHTLVLSVYAMPLVPPSNSQNVLSAIVQSVVGVASAFCTSHHCDQQYINNS
jgi:hypothetical protein